MADQKKPEGMDDAALDEVSGGPTEELFGAYHFLLETAGNQSTEARSGVSNVLKNRTQSSGSSIRNTN